MAPNHDPVKENAGTNSVVNRCLDFMEKHPRTGWYIAVMATLNVVLNLLDAIDFW